MQVQQYSVDARCCGWATIAWVVVFLACGCDKGTSKKNLFQDSANPRQCLKKRLGLAVPSGARNVKCRVEALMVAHVYARLDLSETDLQNLLLQYPLSRLPSPSENPEIVREFQENVARIPWWLQSTDSDVTACQSKWYRRLGSGYWECTLSLCLEKRTERAVLYLHYCEDPVGKT